MPDSGVNGPATLEVLRRIGNDLDLDRYPRCFNGGLIVPSDECPPSQPLGMEVTHGNPRQRRSSTRPRQRTARWQRPAGRPRTPDPAAQFRIGGLERQFTSQLTALKEAYPSVRVWQQELGAWLLLDSVVLAGLSRRARFAVAIPFTTDRVRAWGFWEGLLEPARWIGPRHTNFPEGSICSFDPSSAHPPGAHDLVRLLDVYTLWAFRHLHLEALGRWPGRHTGVFTSERLFEFRLDELCGCGSEGLRYRNCCKESDESGLRLTEAVDYMLSFRQRRLPGEVLDFVCGKDPPRTQLFAPPPIDHLAPLIAMLS